MVMNITDLIQSPQEREELKTIHIKCEIFLEESHGLPLYKNLSTNYGDFQKVKVRSKKATDTYVDTFNEAFSEELFNLHQRAVFANGYESFEPADPITEALEPFYIFPVNGYRYMYSAEVENSTHDYKHLFDNLFEQFGNNGGRDVATDLLKFSYRHERLFEGIERGSEIIIYNLPCYYAMRTSAAGDYNDLLTFISETT